MMKGVTPIVVLVFYSRFAPPPGEGVTKIDGQTAVAYLSFLALLLIGLNFCGGMVLTILFSTFKERIGRLYASDLAGAASGCLASVSVMAAAGPIRAFLLSGVAATAATFLIPREGKGRGNRFSSSAPVLGW